MSQQIEAWFRELIKDRVTIQYQADGGLLDGTMMSGDVQANTVKFPIIGRKEVYKLTGAIEKVPVDGPSLTTVQLTMEDFEASDWWRSQDAYKSGPNEQAALATIITKAIRRKRDTIKLDALEAFHAANPSEVATIGSGSEVPDLLHFEQGVAEILATGAEDQIFTLIPTMWESQLAFYKEFSEAPWAGADNAAHSKSTRMRRKTVRNVTYIVGPDEYFVSPNSGELHAWMWAKEAMGAEMPWNKEAPSITQHAEYQGSPYLVKAGMGGAAVGIQAAGVKRLHLKKITAPTRPAVETIAVTP